MPLFYRCLIDISWGLPKPSPQWVEQSIHFSEGNPINIHLFQSSGRAQIISLFQVTLQDLNLRMFKLNNLLLLKLRGNTYQETHGWTKTSFDHCCKKSARIALAKMTCWEIQRAFSWSRFWKQRSWTFWVWTKTRWWFQIFFMFTPI